MRKRSLFRSFQLAFVVKLLVLTLTFAIMSSFCFLPASAADPVVAEGVGELVSGKEARARDEAINDAYRRAIEKAIGTYISSETKMENMQVIKDEIYVRSRGYVTEYEVLSEEKDKDLYRVKIKAWVKSTPLQKDLASVIKTCGDPKMVVFIQETNLGRVQPFSTIGSSLRSYFQKRGFHLVSKAQVEKIKDKVVAEKTLEGNMEAAVSLANNFEADVLITGKAYTEFITEKTVRSTQMYSTKAYADLRAVITQQAQIVGSYNKTVTEYNMSKKSAGNKALTKISEQVDKALSLKVVDAFCSASPGPSQRSVQLVVTNIKSYSKFVSIIDRLKQIREVSAVHQRLFDVPVGKLDLDLTLQVQDLAYKVEKLKEFNLSVTKFTQSKIEVKVNDG